MKQNTLASRWKDLTLRRERAASGAIAGAAAEEEKMVLTWGKHSGMSFAEAWLDESYVKWCCEHMYPQQVSGNRLAWLTYLSMRMAAEVEALDTLHPDTTTSTSSESAAEIGMASRFAALEARMLSMERVVMRVLAAVAEGCDDELASPRPSD